MSFLFRNWEILALVAVVIFLLRLALRRPRKEAKLWFPILTLVVSVPVAMLSWELMMESSRNSSPGGIVFGLLFGWFAFLGLLAAVSLTMRLLVKSGLLKPRDQLPQRTPRPVVRRYWFWILVVLFGCYLILIVGRGLLVVLDESLQALEQRRAHSTRTAAASEPTAPAAVPTPVPTAEPEQPPPLHLSVTSDKDVYEVGEPILITLTLENLSADPISVFTRRFTPPLPLLRTGPCDVSSSTGERMRLGNPVQPLPAKEADFAILEPDARLSWTLNLYEAPMEALEPDAYTVTCSYSGTDTYYDNAVRKMVPHPWTGEVASNVVSVHVVPEAR